MVHCDSCVHYGNCEKDLKGNSICDRYKTQLILVFNGRQARVQCLPNNQWSAWQEWKELPDPEAEAAEYEQIATELGVRKKDVWLLFMNAPIKRVRLRHKVEWSPISLGPEEKPDKAHIRFDVAQKLLRSHNFLALKESEQIYVYNDQCGIYEPNGSQIISDAIRTVLDEYCTTYDRNETKAIIRDATLTSIDVFNHEEKFVCLQNGFLNLDTMEFHEHHPEYSFRTQIPVTWDPSAECAAIDKFFHEIVSESDVATLYEMIGYCLYPSYLLHKSFMLIGAGANGKSTLLNLLKLFIGPANCSGINLQSLDRSRFSTSALAGKMANIALDIPSVALRQTGTFKALCGGDPCPAEIKFGKHYTFYNYAKLIFSANQIPETTDDSEAFFRRWIILIFPNKFTAFTEPKADPHILHKLTTPTELSGLFNKAVNALQDLLDRGKFTGDKPTAEWREDYIRKSDPIGAFYMDALEETQDLVWIPKTELYQGFVKYCRQNKLPGVDNTVFTRKIKAHFEIAHEARPGTGPNRIRVWMNLKWKEGYDEGLDKYVD